MNTLRKNSYWLPSLHLLTLWLCLGCAACQSQASKSQAAGDETARVKKVLEEIIAADNAADVERIMALYDEEALLLPPNGPAIKGRSAIKQRYQQGFDKARLELKFISEETQVAGDWAFDRGLTRGRNVWRDGKAPTVFEHKYLMILKRQPDHTWKITRLIWNHNATE